MTVISGGKEPGAASAALPPTARGRCRAGRGPSLPPLVGAVACPPGSGATHAGGRSGEAAGAHACPRRPLRPAIPPAVPRSPFNPPHTCPCPLPPSRFCGRAVPGVGSPAFVSVGRCGAASCQLSRGLRPHRLPRAGRRRLPWSLVRGKAFRGSHGASAQVQHLEGRGAVTREVRPWVVGGEIPLRSGAAAPGLGWG